MRFVWTDVLRPHDEARLAARHTENRTNGNMCRVRDFCVLRTNLRTSSLRD